MGTLYVDAAGSPTNSGSSDNATPDLTVTVDASYAGGTTIPLAGSPDLSGISTSGDTQAAIYFGDATNTNLKVFWITAVDNTAKTITVDTEPTGLTPGSSQGNIGGQQTVVQTCVDALRGGDTLIINSSVTQATTIIGSRRSGSPTDGYIKIKGKRGGPRPVLTTTGNSQSVVVLSHSMIWLEYLELQAQGASGSAGIANNNGNANVFFDIAVTDADNFGIGISANRHYHWIIGCEVSGCKRGINTGALQGIVVIGCYVHDCSVFGIAQTGAGAMSVINCIFALNANNAQWGSVAGTSTVNQGDVILGNTFYGASGTGVLVNDYTHRVLFMNNLLLDNGDAPGEYNLEVLDGDWEKAGFHGWNIFHKSSGDNVTGITLNSQVAGSELTSDPLLVDPANGDFAPGENSPAREAGFPPSFPFSA